MIKVKILNPFRMSLSGDKTRKQYSHYSTNDLVINRNGVTVYRGYGSFNYTFKGVLISQRAGLNNGRANDIIDKVTLNFIGPIEQGERFCMYRMFDQINSI